MRSDIKPLARQYKTDFLPQRIHRLNCIFYTDRLFAKEKSIVGNKSAHIFTNGGDVKIIPMISKSEVGTTLDKIN